MCFALPVSKLILGSCLSKKRIKLVWIHCLLETALDYFVIPFYESIWWICIALNKDVNCCEKLTVKLGHSCFSKIIKKELPLWMLIEIILILKT